MTEGIQLAKQIADANQRYYLVKGEYTKNIHNLDIEFSGNDVLPSIKGIETSNFIISASGSNDEIALVQKKPTGTRYFIRIFPDNPNIIYCARNSTILQIQKELCNKLNSEGHL